MQKNYINLRWQCSLLSIIAITLLILTGCSTNADQLLEVSAPIQFAQDSDKIYDYISINGISVSGLTKDEAIKKVTEEIESSVKNQRIILKSGENTWMLDLENLNYGFDVEEAVEEDYGIARSGDSDARYEVIKELAASPYDIKKNITYDDSQINAFLEGIATELYTKPIEPTMKRENGVIIASEGTNGQALDIVKSKALVIALADSKEGGEVELALTSVPPKFSKADLEKLTTVIGTYSTPVTGSPSRDVNLTVAAGYINGTLLYPGQVFSTNDAIGPTTYERGYRSAPVIVNGRLENGMGGGVCQVSSTLYNAVLFSELKVVERKNHSLVVGYCPIGRDATLAGDYIDFKFENQYSTPVYIEIYLNGKTLQADIYGVETRPNNRTLEFVSEYVSAQAVDLYKNVLVDGVVTERLYVDRSTYRSSVGSSSGSSTSTQNADPVESIPEENQPPEEQPENTGEPTQDGVTPETAPTEEVSEGLEPETVETPPEQTEVINDVVNETVEMSPYIPPVELPVEAAPATPPPDPVIQEAPPAVPPAEEPAPESQPITVPGF